MPEVVPPLSDPAQRIARLHDRRSSVAEPSLADRAYQAIRSMIVRLELAPGDVLRTDALRERIGIGRTPIRESLLRLTREHFVTVIPRQGMYVSGIDVGELSMLFETRTVLEPYAARLAAVRGASRHWQAMDVVLDEVGIGEDAEHLMLIDRRCHELMWEAADNRFLLDTLDVLYAQSHRLWHLYLADVHDMGEIVSEHAAILEGLRRGDGDRAADLVETHVRGFDAEIRAALTGFLTSPLAERS